MPLFHSKQESDSTPNWWLRSSKVTRIFVTILAVAGTPVLMLMFRPVLVPIVLAGWWALWWWWWNFSVKFDAFEKSRLDDSKDARE